MSERAASGVTTGQPPRAATTEVFTVVDLETPTHDWVIAPAVVAAPVNETSVGDTLPEPFRRPAIDASTLRGAGRVGRLVVVLVLLAFGVFGPARSGSRPRGGSARYRYHADRPVLAAEPEPGQCAGATRTGGAQAVGTASPSRPEESPMSTDTHPAVRPPDDERSERFQRRPRAGIGGLIAASMAAGLVVATALVAAPFIPTRTDVLTGVVLLGFAFGWAVLAVLSGRVTDHPQRWAVAPAVFFALAAMMSLLGPDTAVGRGFSWVWPVLLPAVVVWSVTRVRRQVPGRARRWLVYPLLAVLAVSAIGGGYETVRESTDAAAYPMPGQLVDVGGHRLHLRCTGSGSPTVVLEPGLGEVSSAMAWIADSVAQDSRVCVYDRAGKGWSDPADGPQDAVHTATDLHTLLDRAHIPGPYVLAGHSFGGLYVLTFAAQYPDQVAGLVLLDSTAPAAGPAPTTHGSYDLFGRIAAPVAALADLGAAHLIGDAYDSLPPQARGEARAHVSTARSVHSYLTEFRAGAASAHQAATLVDFGSKPLVVVTAGRGNSQTWPAAQDKLATLSSNSRHHVVADATHASLYLDQAHAAAAANGIREVVAAARSSQPLE